MCFFLSRKWELLKYEEKTTNENLEVFPEPVILEHIVMPNDTIQGICLRYRISQVTLRQYNNFSGNAFRSKKTLKIPVDPGKPVNVQADTDEILIQKFKNETGETTVEARYYLSENNNNLENAINSWRNDGNWVGQQLPRAIPCAAVSLTRPVIEQPQQTKSSNFVEVFEIDESDVVADTIASRTNAYRHQNTVAPFAVLSSIFDMHSPVGELDESSRPLLGVNG